jgi:uncharacterized damage-inducible protein DinB
MSLGKRALSNDLRYTAWANRLMLDACSELSAEELRRDLNISHQNVISTLEHMYAAEAVWSERLFADTLPALDWSGSTREMVAMPAAQAFQELREKWPPVWSKLEKWFDGLTEEDLDHEMVSHMESGSIFHLTRWKLLRHIVNHATLHRGQVIGMLRGLGKQPPSTDMMTYFWNP